MPFARLPRPHPLAGASILAFGAIALFAQSSAAAIILGTSSNNSVCIQGDSNNSVGSSAPLVGNENVDPCLEAGTFVDNNAFNTELASATGSGTSTVDLRVIASVVTDSAIANDEFERGEVRWDLVLNVTGAGAAAPWTITFDHSINGLMAIQDDGSNGQGQVDFTDPTLSVLVADQVGASNFNFGLDADFNSLGGTSSTTSQAFTGATTGNVISGVGDATVTLSLAWNMDAYSSCDGFFSGCNLIGGGEEAAILLGLDDLIPASFLSDTTVEMYSTHAPRDPAGDGYFFSGTLAIVPEPSTLLLVGFGLLGLTGRRQLQLRG